jgi:hypothetical protein
LLSKRHDRSSRACAADEKRKTIKKLGSSSSQRNFTIIAPIKSMVLHRKSRLVINQAEEG